MGWWNTIRGTTLGDPPMNYLDSLRDVGLTYQGVSDLPGEIRERIDALYVEGLGRSATDDEIADLITVCWGEHDEDRRREGGSA